MAKKRIKPSDDQLIPIADWAHADNLLRQIVNTSALIAESEREAGIQIERIKADLQSRVKPRHDAMSVVVRSLEVFCKDHKAELKAGAKSWKLAHGVLGWRQSTSISVKKNTVDLIKENFGPALRKLCIRVTEAPDKKQLARLTDGQLAEVAARRKTTDEFFAEPACVEAAVYPPEVTGVG